MEKLISCLLTSQRNGVYSKVVFFAEQMVRLGMTVQLLCTKGKKKSRILARPEDRGGGRGGN